MHYFVYQITNVLNGKTYIGCHKTQDKDDGYMGSGKVLKRAVEKHGLENFRKEILFEASSSEEMFTKEKELVVLGPGSYNIKLGGQGGFDHLLDRPDLKKKGYQASKAAMTDPEKNSRAGKTTVENKTGIFDPKYQELRSVWSGNTFRGKHHTAESKEKIRVANTGREPWNKGKPGQVHSPETRAKLSAATKEHYRLKKLRS